MNRKYFKYLLFLLIVTVTLSVGVETARAGVGDVVSAVGSAVGSFVLDILGVRNLFASVGTIMMQLASWFLWASGVLFNYTVQYTVVQMADTIKAMPAINTGWAAFRDLANIAFIFVLIYAGIRTILGLESGLKTIIVNTIIAGLLINFSLFFVKAGIDVSNIVAIQFYKGMVSEKCGSTALTSSLATWDGCISDNVMSALKLTSLYSKPTKDDASKPEATRGLAFTSVITVSVFGTILILITAFVFLVASIMLVIRFVTLTIVMVGSPIMFLSMILPETKNFYDEWWKKFTSQLMYGPVFMALLWLALRVATNDGKGLFATDNSSWSSVLIEGGSITILLNFIVIIAFFMAALAVAKKMSDDWGGKAVSYIGKYGSSAAGLLGRNTLGRGFNKLAQVQRLKDAAKGGNYLARAVLGGADVGRRASYDPRAAPGVSSVARDTGLDLGTAGGAGGFIAGRDERKKRTDAKAEGLKKLYGVDDLDKDALATKKTALAAAKNMLLDAYDTNLPDSEIKIRKKAVEDAETEVKNIKNLEKEKFAAANKLPEGFLSRLFKQPGGVISSIPVIGGAAITALSAKASIAVSEDRVKEFEEEVKELNKNIRDFEKDAKKTGAMNPAQKAAIAGWMREREVLAGRIENEKETIRKSKGVLEDKKDDKK
ncbi:MAG: hypothetical protein AAB597_01075 [Patescibacteria group bacterium]